MKFCPRCHKDPTEGTCVMESMPGFICPEPVEEDANTVVIQCGPCGFTRGVPVGELLKGLPGDAKLPSCKRDHCQATIVRPEAAILAANPAVVFDPAGAPLEVTDLQKAVDKKVLAKKAKPE